MTTKTILVCDNEKDLVDVISFNLERQGYRPVPAFDGAMALDVARAERPDLILLDIMMPRKPGTEVAVALRADTRTKHIPIVMLTAKTQPTDAVVGYACGADHYIRKPFDMKELLALVESILKRAPESGRPEAPAARLVAGPVTLDPDRHLVDVRGEPVTLTLTEFKLLTALLRAKGRVLSRNQLLDQAMGHDVVVIDRTIDVHVTSLRKKLGEARDLIETVRGVGYRLRDDADAA